MVTDESLTVNGVLNRIVPGDCVSGMNRLPERCVDLVFADPPFNIGYEYDVYDDAQERHQYLDWSRQWIGAVYRVLKPSGTFWLAIGDEYAAELKLMSQDVGFTCRSWVVWYYTFGVNCTKKLSRSHAHLFHFVKDEADFTFRSDAIENRIPSARQLVYNDSRANPLGRLPDDTWILRPQDLSDRFSPGEDTWYFPRVAGTFRERAGFHGCQMPEQLLARIIRLCSNPNDLVVDPFAGSATTLVVAKKLGRRFTGFELSPEYVERGSKRLEHVRVGDPLEGAPEPLLSAPATPGQPSGRRRSAGKHASTTQGPSTRTTSLAARPSTFAESMFELGLIEAFRQTSEGFSLDRLVADPELNQRFIATCRTLGLPGDPRTWNCRLFNCRKAGKLVAIPTDRRTNISWQDCDQFLFASEIALGKMLAEGAESLDSILCDPEQARQFDQIAYEYAPGFTSLQYRWAALKLRKEAKSARERARLLKVSLARLSRCIFIKPQSAIEAPDKAGLYLVAGAKDEKCLYAGESLSLRRRLAMQFQEDLIPRWLRHTSSDSLCIRYVTSEPRTPELLAYQSLLVARHKPRLNCYAERLLG